MPRHRTNEERTRLVRAWRTSGHGLDRFARDHGVAPNSVKRWAREVPEEQAFVRLEVEPRATPAIAVQVGTARVIVESGFDRVLLRAVVEALS